MNFLLLGRRSMSVAVFAAVGMTIFLNKRNLDKQQSEI